MSLRDRLQNWRQQEERQQRAREEAARQEQLQNTRQEQLEKEQSRQAFVHLLDEARAKLLPIIRDINEACAGGKGKILMDDESMAGYFSKMPVDVRVSVAWDEWYKGDRHSKGGKRISLGLSSNEQATIYLVRKQEKPVFEFEMNLDNRRVSRDKEESVWAVDLNDQHWQSLLENRLFQCITNDACCWQVEEMYWVGAAEPKDDFS